VAHRAVRRLPGEEPSWQTKGDANRDVDPWPMSASDVRGRVRWGVPGLGLVVSTLTGWTGAAVLVGGPLGLLVVSELRDRRRSTQDLSARGRARWSGWHRPVIVQDLAAQPAHRRRGQSHAEPT